MLFMESHYTQAIWKPQNAKNALLKSFNRSTPQHLFMTTNWRATPSFLLAWDKTKIYSTIILFHTGVLSIFFRVKKHEAVNILMQKYLCDFKGHFIRLDSSKWPSFMF